MAAQVGTMNQGATLGEAAMVTAASSAARIVPGGIVVTAGVGVDGPEEILISWNSVEGKARHSGEEKTVFVD